MQTYHEPARDIAVYGEYDVVVVGGGVSGLTSAIAASRGGARTLIIERFPFFGGTATASLMGNIVGYRNQVEPDSIQTTKGIGEELTLKMIECGAAVKSRNAYESAQRTDKKGDLTYNYAIDTERFKYISLKMVVDSGCDILFHTYFCDDIVENDTIKGIIVENKSGRQAVFAKVVIDASGDGDVAFRAGVPFWQTKADEAHRLDDCLMYKITGFPADTKAKGCLHGDTMIMWGPSPGPVDSTDARQLTDSEIEVRLAVYDDLEEKKKANSDLGCAHIIDTGTLIGIRQTRFFDCVYNITGEDVLEGKQFEDSIAMAANPVIEYYGYRRHLTHTGYDIPYRCLVPSVVEGLLIVGRCMGSDQVAYESWRAMAHLFATGEAAGTAAALCVKTSSTPRNLDISLLQKTLVDNGAEIGQSRKK